MTPPSHGRVRLGLLRIGNSYDRAELAELWGYAGREALTRGVFAPRGDNKILLFVTQQKRPDLTQYRDHISDGLLFWEGEERHRSDRRVAQAGALGDEIHLFFRHFSRTRFEYLGALLLLSHTFHADRPSQFIFRMAAPEAPEADYPLHDSLELDVGATVRERTVETRVGQAKFRQALLDLWDYRCSVTDVSIPEILRASHIKPWRESSDPERLDPANGLLLAPQFDALFDEGCISFSSKGKILIAQRLAPDELARLGVGPGNQLRRVPSRTGDYLGFHREKFGFAHV